MKSLKLVMCAIVLAGGRLHLHGQSPGATPAGIEVSTVKPSDPDTPGVLFTVRGRHFVTINTTVSDMIRFAYGLHPKQIVGAAPWLSQEKFDVDALADKEGAINDAQMRGMAQALLVDRFQFRFHREKKEIDVYALTLVKGGPKLTKTKLPPEANTDFYGPRGELIVRNATMQAFATGLSRGLVDRPVDDQTGLTDRYDFVLKWTFDDAVKSDTSGPPGFYTAMQEQLGLKLTPTKGLFEVMVIDGVARPSTN